MAIVGPGHKARAPNQSCADVVDNVSIEIGHHHDIELLGSGHQLRDKDTDRSLSTGSPQCLSQAAGEPSRLATCMVVLSTIIFSKVICG